MRFWWCFNAFKWLFAAVVVLLCLRDCCNLVAVWVVIILLADVVFMVVVLALWVFMAVILCWGCSDCLFACLVVMIACVLNGLFTGFVCVGVT